MIQELLGGSSGFNFGSGKISINGTILDHGTLTSSPSPSPSPTPSSTTTNNSPTSSAAKCEQAQNLRCPRCDSSNTKFCYYNNYNLTQPRYFCKTCRRYWTKGGALRNVPIGGGCRKNKTTTTTTTTNVSTTMGKSSAAKMQTLVSDNIGRSGFDHELQSSPIIWASPSPQSSHLLALLRNTPNPNPNTLSFKEEVSLHGSHAMNEPTGSLNARTLGLDPLSQVPSLGLCSPLWRNNQQQKQQQQLNNNNGSFLPGEAENTGFQELYQRLKLSTNCYNDSSAVVLSNVGSSSSSYSSSMLDSAPISGGGLGYWNPAFSASWSDLPTTNGAYP